MDLKAANFRYTFISKSELNRRFEIAELFPNISEMSLVSKLFSDYTQCAVSCKGLLEDVMSAFSSEGTQYKLASETNPKFSGQPTVSVDWDEHELARFWVFDKAQEKKGAKISAVARASILAEPILAPSMRLS